MNQYYRYVLLLIFSVVSNVSIVAVGNFNKNELNYFESENFQLAEVFAAVTTRQLAESAASLPDATLTATGSGSVYNGVTVFQNCTNTVTSFKFTNASTTIATNASYTISWGDGSPDFVATSWTTVNHTYQNGLWNLLYTVKASDGSLVTKPYIVFVGVTPVVSLGKPANTDICSPATLTFPITGTRNNPSGTVYTVTFTDGSAPQTFTHPPPSEVTHLFSKSSCGTTSSTFANSFSATISASNPCGSYDAVVAPIYVTSPPVVDFTMSADVSCVNSNVIMTNTSVETSIATPGGCLNPNTVWSISPATGYTLSAGSLGNDQGSTDQNVWTSGSNVISPRFTEPGTYTITMKIGNKCGVDQKIKTICVEPPVVPQFSIIKNADCTTVDVTVINSTIVAKSCTPPVYNWDVVYTPGYCGIAPAFTYTNGTSATSENPAFQFTNPGTYTIRLTMSNSCGTQSATQSVIVEKKPPTVTINNIPDYCGSIVISPTAVVTECSPATSPVSYTWSFPGGNPATANTEVPGAITYSTPGIYIASLHLTNACGVSVFAADTFSVDTVPVLTNTSLIQTICAGHLSDPVVLTSNVPGTTFSWTATASAGVSGFTPSGNTNTIPVQTILTTNDQTGTVSYAITPISGGCSGVVTNYVIRVNPAAAITSQPLSGTVCQGGTAAKLTVDFINGALPGYQWYANTADNNISGTAITGATAASYDPPTTVPGTIYYYCIITFPSAVCTSITSNTANITVTAVPFITLQPRPTQSICLGGTIQAPLTLTYTGGTGNVSYQWYSNTANSNAGGSVIPGATGLNFTPPAFTIEGTYYYYAVITFSGSGCNMVLSDVARIQVVADPVVTTQPLGSQNVCQGAAPANLNVTATGGVGPFVYQWYSNAVNNTTSGSLIAGANGATYTPVTTTLGTGYYYCTITQSTGLDCEVTSSTAAVIVVPVPTFIGQPIASTVCQGGTPTTLSVSYTNGVGAATYQWYENTVDDTASGVQISGAINASYNPSSASVGTQYYYCVISLPSGTCSAITSNTAKVTINAVPAISTQPTPTQDVCIGGTTPVPLSVSYTGGTGIPTYQWYSNTSSSNVGGTIISGGTASTYSPSAFTATGTWYYYVVLTFSGSGCSSVTSAAATVQVVVDPTVSVQALATQTVCQNVAAADLKITASGGIGVFYYQWYSNAVNNTTSGTVIAGATGATFKPLTATVGTSYYYCVVTQAPGLNCDATSMTSEVVVVPALSFKQEPLSSNVCLYGIPTTLFVDYENGFGLPSYQWFSNTADNTASGIPIAGATSSTYVPSTSALGTTYYYCTITLSLGTCTSITSKTANVSVNAVPLIVTHPTNTQNLCVGGTISTPLTVVYSGGAGTTTYQWYSNTTNSNTGGSLLPGATASTFTPPAFTTAGTYYYYEVLNFSGSGCTSLTSNTAEIIVAPDPTVSSQPVPNQKLCESSAVQDLTVVVNGGLGVFSYQWYSNTVNNTTSGSILSGATSATYTPLTSVVGKMYYYCEITQPSGLGCNATSIPAEVIVVPGPTFLTQPVSSTVCEGGTPTILSVTYKDGVGVPAYQWYSNTINDIASATAIPGAINPTYNPPVSTAGIIYYYCMITLPAGGCSGLTSAVAQVTVNMNPKIADKSATICSGATFTVIPDNFTGDIVPPGTTYIWSYPVLSPAGSVSGASVQSIPQTTISQTLTNMTGAPATATYSVTPISGSCFGANFNVVVNVNPAFSINTVVTDITCLGAMNGSIQATITGGVPFGAGAPYTILWNGPNGFSTNTASIAGLAGGVYNLSVTDAAGCPVSRTYTVIEPSAIVINTDNKKDINCFGASNGEIAITVTGGTSPYNYTWTKNTAFYSNDEDLINLGPGVYEVTVSDVHACAPKTSAYTIAEPSALGITLINQTNVSCFGDATGAINVNVFGGTPFEKTPGVFSYNYMWLGPNGFSSTGQNLVGLIAGTYNLVVTDLMGCSKTLAVTISQTSEIILDVTTSPITCYGANNATLSLAISGGEAPYQIQWSNAGSGTFQSNLSAGNYLITVTDNLGCQKIRNINIPEAPVYSITPKVNNITCHGAHNGIINLNFIGGKTPVSLVWSDGPSTSPVRTDLGPGAYTVTISDGTPCYINNTFIITEPQELILSANLTNAFDCNGVNSGVINLLVAGGTAPYTYAWSNGATTEDLQNIPAGDYSVLVTDTNGCSQTGQFVITRPLPIAISLSTIDGYDCIAQQAIKTCTARVTEGVPAYLLVWSRGTASGTNNEIMKTSESGLVVLDVEDALGCISSSTFNVEIKKLGIDYLISDCNKRIYEFNALVLNDQENYTYLWDFGDGSSSTMKSPQHVFSTPGNYKLQLSVNGISCNSLFKETVTVESQPVLSLDRLPKLCIGDSVTLRAMGADFYRWSDGSVADSMTFKQKGDYHVIGRTIAGCLDTLYFSTSYYDTLSYTIQTDKVEVTTDGAPIHFWSEGIPYSHYYWDFGDGFTDEGFDLYHTFDATKAGHYDIKLRVVNPTGCNEYATKRIWITNNSKLNTITPNNDGKNDVFMKDWHIKVYNRNGIFLFEGSDGWDGTYNGTVVSNDTYFYELFYESESGTKSRTGYVTVIR